ncbi:VWA domain-containing protein, partial [Candidatus Woesearchaeota archaeon]|nr:VWA domain-containing protein [Candidatus Woesearchaeota archaeon]
MKTEFASGVVAAAFLLLAFLPAQAQAAIACGDGAVNQLIEQCDDGNAINGDGCDSACQIELPLCEDSVQANIYEFTLIKDGQFNNSEWIWEQLFPAFPATVPGQQASGGNLGAYRLINHFPVGPGPDRTGTRNIFTPTQLDSSLLPFLREVRIYVDSNFFQSPSGGQQLNVDLATKQGETLLEDGFITTVGINQWFTSTDTHTRAELLAAGFDLSASGDPLSFGFRTHHWWVFNPNSERMDNFKVIVVLEIPVCQQEFCGDGIVQPNLGEQCDDGNIDSGDGCSFACTLEVLQQCRVDIDMVLDRSGSMNNAVNGKTKLQMAKNSSSNFINKLLNSSNPELDNLAGLTSFAHDVTNDANLTADKTIILNKIASMVAVGATNYNQSIRMSADKLASQNRAGVPNFMIFLSDGNPTVSSNTVVSGGTTDPEDISSAIAAANYAASQNVPIITIGFGTAATLNETLLMQIASITGGSYHPADPANGLGTVFEDILAEVCEPIEFCGDGIVNNGEQCEPGLGDGFEQNENVCSFSCNEQTCEFDQNETTDNFCVGDTRHFNGACTQNGTEFETESCSSKNFVEDNTFCDFDSVKRNITTHNFTCSPGGCIENITTSITTVENCNLRDGNLTGVCGIQDWTCSAQTKQCALASTTPNSTLCSGPFCSVNNTLYNFNPVCNPNTFACDFQQEQCNVPNSTVLNFCQNNILKKNTTEFSGSCTTQNGCFSTPSTATTTIEDCSSKDFVEDNTFCDLDSVKRNITTHTFTCSTAGCIESINTTITTIENCNLRDGNITGVCGVQDWTCSAQTLQCSLASTTPNTGLCAGPFCSANNTIYNTDPVCNPQTFQCDYAQLACEIPQTQTATFCNGDVLMQNTTQFFGTCNSETGCGFISSTNISTVQNCNSLDNTVDLGNSCSLDTITNTKVFHDFSCVPQNQQAASCQEVNTVQNTTQVQDCNSLDSSAKSQYCSGSTIINRTNTLDYGCLQASCVLKSNNTLDSAVENCDLRDGQLSGACGIEDWSCSQQGLQASCSLSGTTPNSTLCAGDSCQQTFTDTCQGPKLVDFNHNSVQDNVTVTNSTNNFCVSNGGFVCTDNQAVCNAPAPQTLCVQGLCGAACDSAADFQVVGNTCRFGCDLQNTCGFTGAVNLTNFCQNNVRHFNPVCTGSGVQFDQESCSDKNFIEEIPAFCDGDVLKSKKILHEFTCAPQGCQENTRIIEINTTEDCNGRNFNESQQFCSGSNGATRTVHHEFGCVADASPSCEEVSQNVVNETVNSCSLACGATCESDAQCDDGNSNTQDSCNLDTCGCQNTPIFGCIDVKKEALDLQNSIIHPVPQFTFRLDNNITITTDSNGDARFVNVTPGTHAVSEILPDGWQIVSITPPNGTIQVQAGSVCSTVLFKDKQSVPVQFCDGDVLKELFLGQVSTIENCNNRDFTENLQNSCSQDTVISTSIFHNFSCVGSPQPSCQEVNTTETVTQVQNCNSLDSTGQSSSFCSGQQVRTHTEFIDYSCNAGVCAPQTGFINDTFVQDCNTLDGNYCSNTSALETRDYSCSLGACQFQKINTQSCGTDAWTGGGNTEGFGDDPACIFTDFACAGTGPSSACTSTTPHTADFDNLDQPFVCFENFDGKRDFYCSLQTCNTQNPSLGCQAGSQDLIGQLNFACGAECTENSDCIPTLIGNQCNFGGACVQGTCDYQQEVCRVPGTVEGSTCYFGNQACNEDGCTTSSCTLTQDQVCDSNIGCLNLVCEDVGIVTDRFVSGSSFTAAFPPGGGTVDQPSFTAPRSFDNNGTEENLRVTNAALTLRGRPVSPSVDRKLDTVIVTDVSASMAETGSDNGVTVTKLEKAKEADRNFVVIALNSSRANNNNKIGLVSYSGVLQDFTPMTNSTPLLLSEINDYFPTGTTCISCGVNKAIELISSGANPSRAILVMSDGVANRCIGGFCSLSSAKQEAINKSREAFETRNAKVYTVAFGDGEVDRDTLMEMARVGGGRFFEANISTLSSAFMEILAELSSSFPENLTVDIGPNGVTDFHSTQEFNSTTALNFTGEMNSLLSGCSPANGSCLFSIRSTSSREGLLDFSNLSIRACRLTIQRPEVQWHRFPCRFDEKPNQRLGAELLSQNRGDLHKRCR